MDAGSVPVRRRMLLALGAVALLDGCAGPAAAHWHAAPAGTDLPGDSHPEPAAATPSPSAPWQIPVPAAPTPWVCPTVPGVVQHPGGPQHYLPCSGTNIALTIDDGPDPRWTPQILTLLARYRIRATFCVIGRHAAAYPNLVRAVTDGGHHIANHTQTHPIPLTRLSPAQITAQLGQATDAITAAGAPHPTPVPRPRRTMVADRPGRVRERGDATLGLVGRPCGCRNIIRADQAAWSCSWGRLPG